MMSPIGGRNLRALLKWPIPGPVLHGIRKRRYAKIIADTHNYEPEIELIRMLVGNGDCVVDAGASLGWYTHNLSEIVGPDGLVCSVEPMPYQFEILDFVRGRLKLGNVKTINAAFSDAVRTMTMAAPKEHGEPNFYLSQIVTGTIPPGHVAFDVQTIRLDDLQKEVGRRISFVKCDVEGHELQVLAGAGSVLRDSEPSWMIEVWGDPDNPAAEGHRVFELMTREGYGTYLFENHELRSRSHGERSRNGNYFFLRASHLTAVKAPIAVK